MPTQDKLRSALIHLIGAAEWSQRSAADLERFGHRVNQVADYRALTEQASREWADYICGYAVNRTELQAWGRFAEPFSTFRFQSGCDSKLCLVVPRLSTDAVAVAKQTESVLVAEEFGLSAATYVQSEEQHRSIARFSRPIVIVRHGYRGQRSAMCDDAEVLRSARLGDSAFEGTPGFSGEELSIVDVFVRFGPVLKLDDVADRLNTDVFYKKQLGRNILARALPMAISRINKKAARTLHRNTREFQLIGAARGRTGHFELRADRQPPKHFRLD